MPCLSTFRLESSRRSFVSPRSQQLIAISRIFTQTVGEKFPVSSRILPWEIKARLHAIPSVCKFVFLSVFLSLRDRERNIKNLFEVQISPESNSTLILQISSNLKNQWRIWRFLPWYFRLTLNISVVSIFKRSEKKGVREPKREREQLCKHQQEFKFIIGAITKLNESEKRSVSRFTLCESPRLEKRYKKQIFVRLWPVFVNSQLL